jgi:hypothetical protein
LAPRPSGCHGRTAEPLLDIRNAPLRKPASIPLVALRATRLANRVLRTKTSSRDHLFPLAAAPSAMRSRTLPRPDVRIWCRASTSPRLPARTSGRRRSAMRSGNLLTLGFIRRARGRPPGLPRTRSHGRNASRRPTMTPETGDLVRTHNIGVRRVKSARRSFAAQAATPRGLGRR